MRCLTLLNDILDFSKMEAGKMELDHLSFNLRKSLGEVVKTLAVKAQQKGLEFIFDVSPEVPDTVMGDPARLRQVVVNLVGNSIKFTEKGEIEVSVQAERSGSREQSYASASGIPGSESLQTNSIRFLVRSPRRILPPRANTVAPGWV